MTTEYDVRANLTLRDRGFAQTAQRASDRVRRIADRLRGAQRAGGGLFGTLSRLGATYLGFHAITSGIRSAVGGMFSFQMQVEQTRIGLQSILSAVDGISFDEAGRSAQAVWSALSRDAMTSTATTQEMFGIFQGIVGPIRAAGESLQTVRDMTRSTVSAATALGVDLPQAQRDIGLMVRGTAGMDTRLFSVLRSMGLITQETQEWNRNLTTTERIRELERALGSFDAAAAAYGQSFAGATSSFKDIVQQLSGSLAAPIFDRLRRFLLDINRWLIANRATVEGVLARGGEGGGRAMDRIVRSGTSALGYITGQWSMISARFEAIRDALVAHGPALSQLGVAIAGLSALRSALGPILGVVSTLMAGLEAVGIGGGAGGAAGAGAGAGAGGGAGAGLGAMLGPLAIVLAVIAGVVVTLTSYWEQWLALFAAIMPSVEGLWAEFQVLASLMWDALRPILKVLGTLVLGGLVVAFMALIGAMRIAVALITPLMEQIAWIARGIEEYIVDPMIRAILSIGTVIAQFLSSIGVTVRGPTGPKTGRRPAAGGAVAPGPTAATSLEDVMGAVPDARPQTVNNFARGSVQVRQEFREADPDRVLVRMTNALNSAAVQRVGSGFAPALSR
jgi:hypothetical protein